jgi:putative transposase
MQELSGSQLDAMPLAQLVERMDEFILESLRERYGQGYNSLSINLPSALMSTITVRSMKEVDARPVAYLCCAYLIQLQLESISSGFANALLYTESYNIETDWQTPRFRLREAAIRTSGDLWARSNRYAASSLNMQLRKIIKNRGHFPNDESAIKLLWLALRNVLNKAVVRRSFDWKSSMNQFAILYGDRFTLARN